MFNPYQQQIPSFQPWSPYGQQPMQAPQRSSNEIEGVRWVSSMDEVNGTSIGFGQSALFMFTGENAFAIKSVSASGVPITKVFDFKERVAATPESYVTREEFEKLKEQINGQPVVQPAATVNAAEPGNTQHNAGDAVVPGYPASGAGPVLQHGGPDGMDSLATQ